MSSSLTLADKERAKKRQALRGVFDDKVLDGGQTRPADALVDAW